eukprot:TRINITY_DN3602_c0_g1_i2.p1 TRINITY_DN3602_c0_g1~~TRINITY_DN3602_c0_g1_i2.p1  ORF type:complete len:556 (-),score=130.90 TRINITY_DN3602_c0_g1_i2:286-1953(-)
MSCNYAEGLSPYENKGKLGLAEKFDNAGVVEQKVDQLAHWIQNSKHIVLHTGAGISTSAGIPDFRGPRGVWTLEKKGLKPEINVSWDDAKPTPTHMAIAKLVELDIVKFVITQNIDGLHLRSGVPRRNLAELHGNMFVDQCDKCKKMIVRDSPAPTVGQKITGSDCPAYKDNGRKCRGKLRDFVLDWEDNLPDDDLTISDTHAMKADLSIVMGSTLQIVPAGNMPLYAKKYQENGKVVICNLQPTKHTGKADLNIHTYVDDVMRKLFDKLGLSIPEYSPGQDPVKQVAQGELPECGYIDWTQCSQLAKVLKKEGDDIHDQYLKVRREEKKRKSFEDPSSSNHKTKLVKLKEPKIFPKKESTSVLSKPADNDSISILTNKSVKPELKKEEVPDSKQFVAYEVIDIDSDGDDNDDKDIEIQHCNGAKNASNVSHDLNLNSPKSDASSDIEIITEEVVNEDTHDVLKNGAQNDDYHLEELKHDDVSSTNGVQVLSVSDNATKDSNIENNSEKEGQIIDDLNEGDNEENGVDSEIENVDASESGSDVELIQEVQPVSVT